MARSFDSVKNKVIKKSWLTVIDEAEEEEMYGRKWRMVYLRCKCGVIIKKRLDLYAAGDVKSCADCCNLRRSFFTKKIADNQRGLYKVYHGIKNRCYSKNHDSYYLYGAKGVRMCDEWLNDFNSFYEWAMSNGWEKGLEIDKDILGNGTLLYSPETCKVVTHKENANNRSDNHKYPYKGNFYTTYQLSEMFNIPTNTINYRYNVIGMTMEEIEIRGRKKISKWEKK